MRKLFFVKKNVNEPTGVSNWIEMNVDEFNEFISTEEGKARKNNFAPLFGFGTGDADYYIETTREEVSKIRKENNRHAYLKRLEKESGCVTVSLNELDLYGENEQEDRIVDQTAFVDKIYIAKETSAEIQKALSMLTDKQRDIICSLVYTDEPVRVIDYPSTAKPVRIKRRNYVPMFPPYDFTNTVENVRKKFLKVFSEEFTDQTLNRAIAEKELIEYKGDVYVVCKKRKGEASYNSCVDCVRNEGNGKFTVVIAVKMPPNGNKRYVDLPTEKNAAGEFVFTDYPYWDKSE